MRTRATVQAGIIRTDMGAREYRTLIEFAREIEACIAEPAEEQPTPANWRCADSDNCTLACDHKGDHAKTHFCEARCSSRGFLCWPVAAKDAPQPAPTVEALISGLPPARSSDMDAIAGIAESMDQGDVAGV